MLLVAAGGVLTLQNAVVGMRTGKIELRSIQIEREKQPAFFWFALVTEIVFLAVVGWMLVGWLTGYWSFEEFK